jgi:hypothetical protein
MGDGRIFLKSRRDASFNEDLWNEPSLGWIHLAGQVPLKNRRVCEKESPIIQNKDGNTLHVAEIGG